jgi:hypothetical protein
VADVAGGGASAHSDRDDVTLEHGAAARIAAWPACGAPRYAPVTGGEPNLVNAVLLWFLAGADLRVLHAGALPSVSDRLA